MSGIIGKYLFLDDLMLEKLLRIAYLVKHTSIPVALARIASSQNIACAKVSYGL